MRLFIYCERSLIPRAASVEYQVKLLASDTLITFALMLKGPDCHGIRLRAESSQALHQNRDLV